MLNQKKVKIMEPLKEKKLEMLSHDWVMDPSPYAFYPRCGVQQKFYDEAYLLQIKHLKDRADLDSKYYRELENLFKKTLKNQPKKNQPKKV